MPTPKFLSYFLLGLFSLYAQLDISVSTGKKQYLQYEAILLKINLTNNSGRVIDFGGKKGLINLQVNNQNNNSLQPLNGKPVNLASKLVLQPGTTQSLEVQLNQFFDISQVNKYSVYVKAKHQLFNEFSLRNKTPGTFKVSNGVSELRKNFGVSQKQAGKEVIKTRFYEILSFIKGSKRYMSLKIEDKRYVYAIQELGVLIRGIPIQHKVDSFSNIHLVFNIGAKVFKYVVFSADGEEMQRRYLLATQTTYPVLQVDKSTGAISLINDIPAKENIDFNLN